MEKIGIRDADQNLPLQVAEITEVFVTAKIDAVLHRLRGGAVSLMRTRLQQRKG
ncbi:MAG: hypothetical protein AAF296_03860 [Pseudomonadota bacterium]